MCFMLKIHTDNKQVKSPHCQNITHNSISTVKRKRLDKQIHTHGHSGLKAEDKNELLDLA